MKRRELQMKLRAWAAEANTTVNEFSAKRSELGLRHLESNMAIHAAFMNYSIRSMTDEEIEICKNGLAGELLGQYDFDTIRSLPSYGPTTPLAVLRIHHRRIVSIIREFNAEYRVIQSLFKRLKEIDLAAEELMKTDLSEELEDTHETILSNRDTIKDCLAEKLPGSEMDPWHFIQVLFIGERKLKTDDLLQVITVNKRRKHWDGELATPFSKIVANLPEELDYNEFERLIFIEKLEDDRDNYLSTLQQNHIFKVMDQYKEEHGKPMIDTFALLEEITGKPVQTFVANQDEYGDIVSMEPSKPRLTLIDGVKD